MSPSLSSPFHEVFGVAGIKYSGHLFCSFLKIGSFSRNVKDSSGIDDDKVSDRTLVIHVRMGGSEIHISVRLASQRSKPRVPKSCRKDLFALQYRAELRGPLLHIAALKALDGVGG